MDCKTARRLAEVVRPDDLGPELPEGHDFQGHLSSCGDCREYAHRQLLLDDQLGRAIRAVDAPADFRERLLTRLANERNAFYRQWLFRASAAAVLLIATGFFAHWWMTEQDKRVAMNTQRNVPQESIRDDAPTPEAVEQWFSRHGQITLRLPKELAQRWDFHYLTDKSVTMHGEHALPTLRFEKQRARAIVILLRRDAFDPDQLPDLGQSQAMAHHVLGKAEAGEYIALVLIHEGVWQDFLKPPPRAVA